jgi:hypothetical protein
MEYAFDVRPVSSPVGFGAVPHVDTPRTPVGVGQSAAGGTIQYVNPIRREKWVIAYIAGDSGPRVKTLGTGFSYKQMLASFVASGKTSQYFVYRGSGGTYVFACVYSNGVPCIKMALDGSRQAGVGRAPTGVGQLALGMIQPISSDPNCARWVSITPATGPNAGLSSAETSNLFATLQTAWSSNAGGNGNGWKNVNGAYHFLYGSSAGTVGEASGVMLLKFWIDGSGGSNLSVCSQLGTQQVTQSTPVVSTTPVVSGPIPVSSTDQGSYQWGVYMWQYFSAGAGDVPSQPPPGQSPQGAWVNTTNDGIQFDWYPGPGQLETITDPSGNVWWIYSSYHGANGDPGGVGPNYQPPVAGSATPPPVLAGTTGAWSGPIHPYYQVWIPSTAMSTAEILLLAVLGIGVLGGVVYLATE